MLDFFLLMYSRTLDSIFESEAIYDAWDRTARISDEEQRSGRAVVKARVFFKVSVGKPRQQFVRRRLFLHNLYTWHRLRY